MHDFTHDDRRAAAAQQQINAFLRDRHETLPEALAQAIGDDPTMLRTRFAYTVANLYTSDRVRMRGARFDPVAKTLTGQGIRLTYHIRRHPDQPVAYRNQQTSWGYVAIEHLKGDDQ